MADAEETPTRETFTDSELLYAATGRCRCGAGLAYPLDHEKAWKLRAWLCSSVLKGEGQAHRQMPAAFGHAPEGEHDAYDWSMYKVREETSVNNDGGRSTRPPGTVARTVATASCPKCGHKWESEPYDASTIGHHWRSGACPGCGLDHGGDGCTDSRRGPSIDMRFRDVVLPAPVSDSNPK
jgi:hypothetical protein